MTASGVKVSLSIAAQSAASRFAVAGTKAASGQGSLVGSARLTAVARRDAFAVAALRAQPSLAVVGVTDRAGNAALYARASAVAEWSIPYAILTVPLSGAAGASRRAGLIVVSRTGGRAGSSETEGLAGASRTGGLVGASRTEGEYP